MTMRIVIGVDESNDSQEAVDTAYDMFGREAEYTLVCIHERTPFVVGGFASGASLGGLRTSVHEQLGRRRAMAVAERRSSSLPDDADVSLEAAVGHAGAMISQIATDADADLLAIGSRSSSFWDRVFTPSVTRHLIDHAPCPVLVVR